MSTTRILQMTNPGAGLNVPVNVVDTAYYGWWASQGWELVTPDTEPLPFTNRLISGAELEQELDTRLVAERALTSATYVRYEAGELLAPDDSVIPMGAGGDPARLDALEGSREEFGKGVVFYSGSAWPTRPEGYAVIEWRGPASAGDPPINGTHALDGVDEVVLF